MHILTLTPDTNKSASKSGGRALKPRFIATTSFGFFSRRAYYDNFISKLEANKLTTKT